ncbi:hypothetical protein [Streptomyces atriruber]|uniref:hypothetical protein n=1 Tax=Streptomyces atriruber TaxID=545121 RepID=UPI000B231347|nr:hypothetical protein [Streptomyces atriruber]
MATSEQVEEGLRNKLLGKQQEYPGFTIEVLDLRVPEVRPTLTVQLKIQTQGQQWQVTLNYKGPEASLVSGDLDPDHLTYLAFLMRTHLFEWWDTKDTEKLSKKMGQRLN